MTKLTTLDLSPFYRQAVGFDRLFDRIVNNIEHASSTNYPPYNIIETGENTWEVQVAVAGFGQGDINVQVKDGDLIITGEKENHDLPEGQVYRHQGISARKFIRTFSLGEYMEVKNAVVKDGILSVSCEREIPEAAKPKTIAITYTN